MTTQRNPKMVTDNEPTLSDDELLSLGEEGESLPEWDGASLSFDEVADNVTWDDATRRDV
jgi:hypothetical protein